MTDADQQNAIAEAFQKWKNACSVLSFTQTTDYTNPDFKIRLEQTLIS